MAGIAIRGHAGTLTYRPLKPADRMLTSTAGRFCYAFPRVKRQRSDVQLKSVRVHSHSPVRAEQASRLLFLGFAEEAVNRSLHLHTLPVCRPE